MSVAHKEVTMSFHELMASALSGPGGTREFVAVRSCCGVTIRFESNSDSLLCALVQLLPVVDCGASRDIEVIFSLAACRDASGAAGYEFRVNGSRLVSAPNLDRVCAYAEQCMREAIAVLTPDFVFVHAGVVGWQGKAIVIPGASCSGKSTLVMALVAAGATFYSDEYAVLDSSARVHAYRRAPQVRGEQGRETARQIAAVLARSQGLPCSLPVGAVLATEFRSTEEWSPRRLAAPEVFQILLRNSVAVRCHPARTIHVLKQVSLSASCFRSGRGEAAGMAGAVLQFVSKEYRHSFGGVQ
jgi:hypothetical protein